MAAALAAKVLPFGLFETRRLVGAAVGILGLFVTWRLGRRLGGPLARLERAGAARRLPALLRPHVHEREGRALRRRHGGAAARPRARLRRISEAERAHDGAGRRRRSAWPSARACWPALAAPCGARRAAVRSSPRKAAPRGWQHGGAAAAAIPAATLLPALVLGYLIMGLLWPWSVLSPLNPLHAAEYFDTFFEKPWEELYEGRLIPVPDMPASYLPHLFVLKLPEIMLALGADRHGRRLHRRRAPQRRRSTAAPALLIVALAAMLPVALAMVTRPALYNGLRHFIFVVPPFAVLGGLAAAWLDRARAPAWQAPRSARSPPCSSPASPCRSIGMVRLHPYEYIYFNALRRRRARRRSTATCSTIGALPSNRRPTNCARGSPPAPSIRRKGGAGWWRSAARSRRRGRSSGRNSKPPSTARAPTSSCRSARSIAGTCRGRSSPIERDGVVFARVYDMRGARPEKLLTQPPP